MGFIKNRNYVFLPFLFVYSKSESETKTEFTELVVDLNKEFLLISLLLCFYLGFVNELNRKRLSSF